MTWPRHWALSNCACIKIPIFSMPVFLASSYQDDIDFCVNLSTSNWRRFSVGRLFIFKKSLLLVSNCTCNYNSFQGLISRMEWDSCLCKKSFLLTKVNEAWYLKDVEEIWYFVEDLRSWTSRITIWTETKLFASTLDYHILDVLGNRIPLMRKIIGSFILVSYCHGQLSFISKLSNVFKSIDFAKFLFQHNSHLLNFSFMHL